MSDPNEPPKGRRAEIERLAAEMKAKKEALVRNGHPEYADRSVLAVADAPTPPKGKCPRCGSPMSGVRKRCYTCNPGGKPGPKPRNQSAPAPAPAKVAVVPPVMAPPSVVEVAPAWALVVRDLVELGTTGLPTAAGLQGAYHSALELCLRLKEAIRDRRD